MKVSASTHHDITQQNTLATSDANQFLGEKARICAAGGFVDFGRVNGNLALSRAIGDFEFKRSAELSPEQQIVTAYPDVVVHEISENDEFLVVACDGRFARQAGLLIIAKLVYRYLGLPVFAGCDRIRSPGYRCKADAREDL